MKVLLVGGSGQLGSEIRARWTGDEIAAPSHAELDLGNTGTFAPAIERYEPELVVNCAAFHNVDTCEREPDRALQINASAVDALARAAHERGSAFMTISTDYVFDGEARGAYGESECARPINAYGVSKLAGELLVLRRSEARSFVVRTCGVFGLFASPTKGYTFIDRIVTQARAGESVRVVDDVVASPTYAGHLAEMLRRIVSAELYGLVHAVNEGPVSWYDFAARALQLAGIERSPEAISASAWKAAARRPAFSALANRRLAEAGLRMPSWEEGIAAYLRDKASDRSA